uniref:Bacterial pre-peptidase C-terminal domain family protein n=2 Tax=Thermoplasmatota TaxID=2283796 RepID=A0A1B1TB11_9ARCH|nr:Bacterial pre-peptidase C-terminal domain family protein [uncultured Candidatus Thalassoarchaea sp.]
MRTLVVIVISFLVALQPMLSLESPSVGEETNISFSGYVNYEDNSDWWEDTSMDTDKDGIQDSIWLAIDSKKYNWVDDDGRIGVIVDFDHLPTPEDEILLTSNVDFVHFHTYHLIDSIAGSVAVEDIVKLSKLPGVVMIELDGILEIVNSDAKEVHGVGAIYEETGYNGSGSVVAIIDTGIDGEHVGLDDLDDDNSTDDPKIIAFFDAVNNASATDGTVVPYDDHGHGSHCAGTTAGTGAPTYDNPGMAPQAQLVGVKVLDGGGSGSFAGVMLGMEWTVEKRHDFNIRAASMSLGGFGLIEWTSSEEESVNRMANEMVRNGIALFIAAGNSAVSAQIGTPGSAEDVITVGALDKDTKIAVYSSQGPTEEGRVKPNIAFVGSSVMSVEANTGTGYRSMSGTSMATPGAAGVAALMYQANPDLSPFDIRNIMQETSTYRQCHYMGANEPCAEDGIPKNRQNNVYGHGQVEALPAVMEAANLVYGFTNAIDINLNTPITDNSRVNIGPNDNIAFDINGDVDKIQWRTWDMRDDWMDLTTYDSGLDSFEIEYSMFVDRLKYLPGNEIEGNQTLLIRAIKNTNSSANEVVHIQIMGNTEIPTTTEDSPSLPFGFVIFTSMMVALYKTRRID